MVVQIGWGVKSEWGAFTRRREDSRVWRAPFWIACYHRWRSLSGDRMLPKSHGLDQLIRDFWAGPLRYTQESNVEEILLTLILSPKNFCVRRARGRAQRGGGGESVARRLASKLAISIIESLTGLVQSMVKDLACARCRSEPRCHAAHKIDNSNT